MGKAALIFLCLALVVALFAGFTFLMPPVSAGLQIAAGE